MTTKLNGTEAAVAPPLACSQDEAIARFYGEWVLFQILEVDEYQTPVRGLVFAHSPDRSAISKVLATLPRRTKDQPFQPYYTFYARPRAHVGETIEGALARFERQRAEALNEAGIH
ncbi:MAG: hypothetical protein QOF33_4572 [Thermomicrobiales bacterium]|jgi:hypothetical protein|nr:hypothetical protein [Thermomicrobiales bacterium]MEA2586487.1 hypothetical protein [Thermomicrobiales bacterium]